MEIAMDYENELLPRRDRPKCPNPWCGRATNVPGEFCRACRDQQAQAVRDIRDRDAGDKRRPA